MRAVRKKRVLSEKLTFGYEIPGRHSFFLLDTFRGMYIYHVLSYYIVLYRIISHYIACYRILKFTYCIISSPCTQNLLPRVFGQNVLLLGRGVRPDHHVTLLGHVLRLHLALQHGLNPLPQLRRSDEGALELLVLLKNCIKWRT